MVLVAAADDFSSGEIRFDERYFFRHPLHRRRHNYPLTTIPTDVLFSLSIFPLSSLYSSYILIDHCAHEYIVVRLNGLTIAVVWYYCIIPIPPQKLISHLTHVYHKNADLTIIYLGTSVPRSNPLVWSLQYQNIF